MFTGIVAERGEVLAFEARGNAHRLRIRALEVTKDAVPGDSIAVDGCCLTVTSCQADELTFDLLAESVAKTRFATLRPGAVLNLESSLRFNGKMGGHFVTGHVDAVGTITTFEERGDDWFLEVAPPAAFMKYLVYKGSIAINGVSLTVAAVSRECFAVWLIPHTLERTNLPSFSVGDAVNLEFDLLSKYVERLLPGHAEGASSSVQNC